MDLYEYQIKHILSDAGIPVLKGAVAYTANEARQRATEIGGVQWLIKPQVYAYTHLTDASDGPQVRIVNTPDEAYEAALQLLAKENVRKVYVEEMVKIKSLFGVGIRIDLATQQVILVIKNNQGELTTCHITYEWNKTMPSGVEGCLVKAKIPVHLIRPLQKIIKKLFAVFMEYRARAVEVPMIALTEDERLVVLESRIVFDSNALFYMPQIARMKETDVDKKWNLAARKNNFKYMSFDGTIACLVNGIGLGLATLDAIHQGKAEAACLLDIGTEPSKEVVSKAFKLILSEPNIEGVLVNIFGGVTRCDVIASGLISASKEISVGMPIVVRMDGTNAAVGERLLAESGLPFIVMHTMSEAVHAIIQQVEAVQ